MRRDWTHLARSGDLGDERIVVARVEPREIGYINALIEGHEGLTIMRTADARRGIVCLWVPQGQRGEVEAMIEGLRREVSLAVINPEDPTLRGLSVREWEQARG